MHKQIIRTKHSVYLLFDYRYNFFNLLNMEAQQKIGAFKYSLFKKNTLLYMQL